MSAKAHVKGLIERKLENPEYRRRFEEEHELFKLEVQLLTALERQGMTYEELAKRIHTSRSHISRDLRQGGISSAKLGRIRKMADALGLAFIPLVLPKRKVSQILPRLERLLAA